MMGLLVAAYVLTQEVCERQTIQINAQLTEESEDQGEEKQEEPVVQILSLQMLPAVSFELAPFEAFFIRELFTETQEPLPFIANVPLEDTHYFKTLFRQIQSPNAP